MKDVLTLFARYNQHADDELYSILAKMSEEDLTENMGSYFSSIMGLLNHSLLASINWLNRFKDSSLPFGALDTPVLDIDNPGFGKALHTTFSELQDHQQKIDRLFITFIEGLTDSLLQSEVVYRTSSGEELKRIVWQALLHLFNHQTHHRGQISQILDSKDIDNDFSGLAAVL